MQSLTSTRGGGQAVLAVMAIICIVVAGYFIIKQTKPKQVIEGGIYYYCTSCKKEFEDSPDKIPPIKCPYCGEVAGAELRKLKCKECGEVFRAYLLKWDTEGKRAMEKRKEGQYVPYEGGELVSGPEGEFWVDSESRDGFDLINGVVCPNCGASGENLEAFFPEKKKEK
jgi:YHS domain-containing protein